MQYRELYILTGLPLMLTVYITMVHVSALRDLHWYNTVNFSY